jgi:hypothetical protein
MGWFWKDFADGSKRLRKGTGGIDAITVDKDNVVEIYKANVQRYVDVTLTPAEVKALNATPKTIVAAPGAGKALVFDQALVFLAYGTAAYAGIAAGEDLAVKYTNAAGLQVASCEVTGFLDATANAFRLMQAYRAASGVSDIAPAANAALVLHMLTGEITTGDSPVKLRVYYRVIPTTLA